MKGKKTTMRLIVLSFLSCFVGTWIVVVLQGAGAAIGTDEIETAIAVASEKLSVLADETLSGNGGASVDYTDAEGRWTAQQLGTWTSGHLPGCFWLLYGHTGKEEWKSRGQKWTEGMASRITAPDNDTGFQIYCSFGMGRLIGGVSSEDYEAAITRAAAELVRQRYNASIGCFRAWPGGASNPTDLPFEVIIDQMINLELVLYAAELLGRDDWRELAIRHADTTWKHHIRENGSTYHVVEYDGMGNVVSKRTHQGWRTSSTWSRGQAWAVYGYAMVYRYTGEKRFLERALLCLEYFNKAVAAQSDDGIAYSDFDAPLDEKNPRDTSASAIVASALMDLYTLTGEDDYRAEAARILGTLSREYLTKGSKHEAVLSGGSQKWGLKEVGTIFGDYYFLEALARYKAPFRG